MASGATRKVHRISASREQAVSRREQKTTYEPLGPIYLRHDLCVE